MNGAREPCPDEAIVRAARADPATFELLYDRYVEAVYKFCRRRLGDETAAEDAASAIFLKALEALPRFEPVRGGFRAWLFTIAFTVVTDQQRARLRRPEAQLDQADAPSVKSFCGIVSREHAFVSQSRAVPRPSEQGINEGNDLMEPTHGHI